MPFLSVAIEKNGDPSTTRTCDPGGLNSSPGLFISWRNGLPSKESDMTKFRQPFAYKVADIRSRENDLSATANFIHRDPNGTVMLIERAGSNR